MRHRRESRFAIAALGPARLYYIYLDEAGAVDGVRVCPVQSRASTNDAHR